MRLKETLLLCGVTAGLALAVTLVITGMGTREPVQRLQPEHVSAAGPVDAQALIEQPGESIGESAVVARTRTANALDDGGISPVDAARRREGRKREDAFLAEFLALRTEQGPEVFARSVRDVLNSRSEPQCRKAAGLRALHSAGAPGTDAVLAAAVEGQADVSDGSSLSVPRCALRLLFERAPTVEDARRALARLAFVPDVRVSPDLRREASTALAGSIRGPQHDEVVRLLRLEAAPAQLDAALAALSRDTNFGAAPAK